MTSVGRVVVLCVAGLILLAAASVPALAATPSAASCSRSCGQDKVMTRTGAGSPVESCIRDAGCGGGGSLTVSALTLLAACATAVSVVVGVLSIRRHRMHHRSEPAGSLLAGRLFRPPRFVLGI